ncbi:MAG: calcium/proton exchanger [Candidatus Promineofilum sp.]|nr:calcium/proton exchanger [Promineifilum sp.]MBP9657593.1 calcium/proton exchanger [Promineifilum sp.]
MKKALAQIEGWIGLSPILLIFALFIPIAIILEFTHANPMLILLASAAAIIPLAGMIGEGTEALAEKIGERAGGLLNATLGNAAELIIAIVALRKGLIDLVLASITGSILGNLLLIMGLSLLVGGLRHGLQKFNREHAGLDGTLLVLAVFTMAIPSFFNQAIEPDHTRVTLLSVGVAIAILVMYGLVILHSFTSKAPSGDPNVREAHAPSGWSTTHALIVLVIAVGFIALLSEFLVGAVEPVTESLGLSEFFLGIILIPLVGNAAEHFVAVQVASKNKMDLALSIAIGSSLQIALFVAPLLVFISIALGHPMPLEFTSYEVLAVTAASLIAALVSLDGRSNWLEGAMLLMLYVILAVGFFFL